MFWTTLRHLPLIFGLFNSLALSFAIWPANTSIAAGPGVQILDESTVDSPPPLEFNPKKHLQQLHRRVMFSRWCSVEQEIVVRDILREVFLWSTLASFGSTHTRIQPIDTMEEITLNRVFQNQPRNDASARTAVRLRFENIINYIENEGYAPILLSCNDTHPRSRCGPPNTLIDTIQRANMIVFVRVALFFTANAQNLSKTTSNLYALSSVNLSGILQSTNS